MANNTDKIIKTKSPVMIEKFERDFEDAGKEG